MPQRRGEKQKQNSDKTNRKLCPENSKKINYKNSQKKLIREGSEEEN
jgi:hypothetical protein